MPWRPARAHVRRELGHARVLVRLPASIGRDTSRLGGFAAFASPEGRPPGPLHSRSGRRSMWGMAKKKAKNVKPKASKRPAQKRTVTTRARPVTKTPSRARPAAAKKRAKAVVKATKPVAAKAVKRVAATAPTAAPPLAKTSPRSDSGLRRRDGAGHLDPKYAADLRRQSGRPESEGVGFLASSRSTDDLAEALGEQFIEGATTGEGAAEEQLDQEVPEERGGPFVRSNAGTEFAEGVDRSNPKGAKREPFPTT